MSGPLTGMRVVDLGDQIAGPFVATLFGDFGADVIKVEKPGGGDKLRAFGPFEQGISLRWLVEARNKRSLTLDLRNAAGMRILKQLLASADVLVENHRPGVLEAWGLGPDVLSGINPALVLVRVSGFGQTGPYRTHPGYDRTAIAMGGWQYVTGEPDSLPLRPGVPAADYLAGVFGFLGALLALLHRERTPGAKGQLVDVALYEPLVRLYEANLPHYSLTGVIREREGSRNPNAVPADTFICGDEQPITMSAFTDQMFAKLAVAMGQPELADPARFGKSADRIAGSKELYAIVAAWFKQNSSASALATLQQHSIPASRIYSAADIVADEHFRIREAVINATHPVLGSLAIQGVVPKLSDTPGSLRWLGPELGQHTEEILRAIAISDDEIRRLRDEHVI